MALPVLPPPTRFVEANGLRFAIEEAGKGDSVALLLHGFPENRGSWRHQMAPLAALGWHVVAPDLRGYGLSSKPRDRTAYRIGHLVADVVALFDALGARRRLLIGHDWGAAIAWSVAIANAVRLDGLVAMNVPHPAVFRAVLRRSAEQKRRSWYIALFQLPWLPEALLTAHRAWGIGWMIRAATHDRRAFTPEVIDGYRASALAPGAMTAMLNYYRANARAFLRADPGAKVEVPTLLIWGEDDVALSLEMTEGYEDLVADFTLKRLPGVSHWVQQETPGAVNDVLGAWLVSKGLDRSSVD